MPANSIDAHTSTSPTATPKIEDNSIDELEMRVRDFDAEIELINDQISDLEDEREQLEDDRDEVQEQLDLIREQDDED